MGPELLALVGLTGCNKLAKSEERCLDAARDTLDTLCDDYPGFVPYGAFKGKKVGALGLGIEDLSATGTYETIHSCEIGCLPAGIVGQELCTEASCGGDPVGTWTYMASCTSANEPEPFGSFCPEGTIEDTWSFTGTLTFSADGTFEKAITRQQLVHSFYLPQTCTEGEFPSCSDLEYGITCAGSPTDGGCVCVDVLDLGDGSVSGTWTQQGSSLTFSQPGTGDYSADLCATGTQLVIDDGVTVDVLVR